MKDKFFTKERCDRCKKSLEDGRTMSWFTTETICFDCSYVEHEIKKQMRKKDVNPNDYEECGYIPQVEKL